MHFLYGLFIFAFAGVINGSFALPSKRLTKWSYQRIWFHYSLWAFLIFPVLLLLLFAPTAWHVYAQASLTQISIIFCGGFLFAIGQICFARALQMIGLGLGFVINISIGTALGSLIPLIIQHTHYLYSLPVLLTMLAILLIITGVYISYIAGSKRDHHQPNFAQQSNYVKGVLCAVVAGLFSAGQNITFSMTANLQTIALQSGMNHVLAANIIWPAFLLATFFPYAAYMLYLQYRENFMQQKHHALTHYIGTMLMGAFWYFSLILYSAGSFKLGELGPVIGWPLFMVCIILTANLWGWQQNEWLDASLAAKRLAKLSIFILILAIMVLGYAAFLRH